MPLRTGIAAGCNLLLTVDLFTILSNLSFLSPDGVCHSFDNRANGYGRGEGFGVLIVKSLDDALQNGDTIRAVIRATGTNQNGHTNLAQPSKEMQRQLIERTYRKANIDMSQTRFFEAHGTGTAIGDPIEAMAIGEAFGSHRDQNDPLIVGSVKANIGHLEGAAGIAAVIKTILVLERGVIPPVAQLGELNENIDANFLHLKFPRTPIPWPHPGLRRASVNSFGFGGTNAHVIIDDAFSYLAARELVGNHCTTTTTPTESSHNPSRYSPKVQPDIENHRDSSLGRIPLLFTWSAKDSGSINRMTQVYKEYLEQATRHKEIVDGDLGSLAYTLSRRRSLYSWRTFAAANSVSHLIEKLAAMGETIQSVSNRKAAFVFTGQGAQWAGMGKELLSFPMFRSNVLEADEFLQGIGCGWKASDFLLHAEDTLPKINKPQFSQPLCTILQVAIVELLRSFRIYPLVVVGHSSGEIAAAYTTGAICRQSAWKLAYFRGLVSDELDQSSDESTRGAMMAVGASESLLRPYVEEILAEAQGGILCTACLNSPQNTTLAGDRSLIESLKTRLSKVGFFTSILKVPVAYHSPHMARIAPTYRQLIGNLIQEKTSTPHVSMVSSVTGSIISGSELRSPEYWVKNMTSQVRFSDAIERIFRDSTRRLTKKLDMSHRNHLAASDLVEIGPHSALKGPIREISQASRSQLSYTPTLVRGESASMALLNTIGTLHCRGFDVDLAGINRLCGMTKKIPKVLPSLPGYPYDHSGTYWSEPRIARNMRLKPFPYNEFLGLPVADWNPLQPRWRNTLKTTSIAWLEEHQINGEILYPAAGMLVMAIEAITQISHGREITGYELRNVEFRSRLSIPANDIGKEVQFSLSLSEDASSWSSFSLFACGDEFTEICRGDAKAIFETHVSLCSVEEGVRKANHIRDLIAAVDSSREAEMHSTGFYQLLSRNGYRYGPSFQGVRRSVRNNCGEEVGDVSIWRHAVNSSTMPPSVIHPCTLDSIVQLVIPGDPQVHKKKIATWLPTYITRLWISSSGFNQPTGKDRIRVYVAKQPMSARLNSWSVFTADGDSRGLLEIKGLQTTLVADNTQDAVSTATQQQARRLCYDVVWKPDHTLHDTDLMSQYIRDYASTEFGPTKFSPILKIFILGSIFRAERKVSESTIPVTTPHLQKQYAWIQKQTSLIRKILPSSRSRDTPWFAEEPLFNYLRDYMKASGRIGEIYVAFDRHIVNIFQGTTDAPQFLLRDNLLQEYSWLLIEDAQFHGALHRYVDALAHKTPGIKILGVEAGFGAVTKSIIKILSTPTTNGLFCRFSRCDIASPSQPIEISSKGDDPISNTYFCAFDIEEPIQCGFEENSYDLILLVNVS
ncbi:hypothetical protein F4779DRAFT_290516 [Xylariaceae sp. FL0662B]|nr:hypothetical protein F4779DRAFT_290516 [Xylariaceae sp. FL0662B]